MWHRSRTPALFPPSLVELDVNLLRFVEDPLVSVHEGISGTGSPDFGRSGWKMVGRRRE
jgi:hypothetical protein